jgi:hypothetical protein
LLGAEITGTIAVALCGVLLALAAPTAWIPLIVLPVILAGAGPVGYDMAQSWVPEDERLPAAAAGLLAVAAPTVWVPFLALPVVLAGAGPVGYDMAQSWVPDDERFPAAPAGLRAAVHAAGVAVALLLALAVVGVAGAAPSAPTLVIATLALLGLPYLTAVARNLAVPRVSGPKAVLPLAVGVIVAAAPALLFGCALLLGRLIGDD